MVEAAGIKLQSVRFSIGDFTLADASLDVAAGEYFVLMGPNGAGKTILLKLLAGILSPDSGEMFIAGANVTDVPPWERVVGYLPQDYALFPDRSVYRNIAFGLEVRGVERAEEKKEVGEMAELLGISRLLDRMPGTLSGGECQKVSLARALVIRPMALLLDEPVSAVDEESRDRLCAELKRVQKEAGVTAIHVCHNIHEMLAVADRAAVITDGRVLQVGLPDELLRRPGSEFVARFLGARNILRGTAISTSGGSRLRLTGGQELALDGDHHGPLVVSIRPEEFELHPSQAERAGGGECRPEASALEGVIAGIVSSSESLIVSVDCGVDIKCSVGLGRARSLGLEAGQRVYLSVRPSAVNVLEAADGPSHGQAGAAATGK